MKSSKTSAFCLMIMFLLSTNLPVVDGGDGKDDDSTGIFEALAHIAVTLHFTYNNPALGIIAIVLGFSWAILVHCCVEEREQRNFMPAKKTRYAAIGLYVGSQACSSNT